MSTQIISIGTELVFGQTIDTNAAWLAQQLAGLGIRCSKHVTIADDRAVIANAISVASAEADLVLVTGGLGPTPDDLTRHALADALAAALRLHQPSLDKIAAFFRQRRRTMSEANRIQAMIPESAHPIENTCGTAPGLHARLNDADVFVMPGVPREMKTMFDRDIRPALWHRRLAGGPHGPSVILQHTLQTFGSPESELGEKIADLMEPGRNPSVGTSAADLVISIRINAHASTPDEARRLIDADTAEIRRRLGQVVFGEQGDTLAHAVAKLLKDQHKTIASAESCTGGLIAKRLTDVPGSSAYMVQGLVTYADEAKHRLLDIPMDRIEAHGAVSREVAEAMAANCRRLANTDYALSSSGIAGPTGGTRDKPVGLVYIALADAAQTTVKELRLGETLPRDAIRDRTAKLALNLLRLRLIGSC
ncbi:MAG: competence/damage-inducible protein A [Phycisphaerae bacterium]|nr:competence/damage-inducible protein A [Phycisphaerae bacterium]